MRIIIDVNIWVSFCIGQHLDDLPIVMTYSSVELFICEELEEEFTEVSNRPRLAKYMRRERVEEVFYLMNAYGIKDQINRTGADFVDAKDNYLLDFSQSVDANYLITGDQNLLALGVYYKTKIISFKDFIKVLREN